MTDHRDDDFRDWRRAIAGKPVALHADHPQPGFYKVRDRKDGPWLPVAIWRRGGDLVCRVGAEMRDPSTIWTWAAKNPVRKEDAKVAFETGAWPGDISIGHNSGDLPLDEEIAEACALARDWLTSTPIITAKADADRAANYRARLLELKKRAETEHETKKAPHLEAGRRIDAEYKPLIGAADETAKTLRAALSIYLAAEDAKAKQAAEAEAHAENARRRAEFQRQQKEAAAGIGEPPSVQPTLVAPMPVRVQAGGQRGKKASLRTVTRCEITDYAAALAHVHDHPDVRAAVEKAAFAQARTGAAVPGVRVFEEKVAV